MVNVEELFSKLENGEELMQHEIIFLKELLRLVDELYGDNRDEASLVHNLNLISFVFIKKLSLNLIFSVFNST